jgi:hypothetical protein
MTATVNDLRNERSQEVFLEQFGNAHPQLTGGDIDLAFHDALREVAPSDRVELLERAMEARLGIVSDEEE